MALKKWLLLCLCGISVVFYGCHAAAIITDTPVPTTTVTTATEASRLPTVADNTKTIMWNEDYNVFVYGEGLIYYWMNGDEDMGDCVSEYLYTRHRKTGVITLLWESPVSDYVCLNNRLLVTCVGKSKIFEIIAPLTATEFYSGENETVDRLVYTDDYLFFTDGNILKMYDRVERTFDSLCVCEDIKRLVVRNYDNAVFWCNSKEEYFAYSIVDNTHTPIDYEDVYIGRPMTGYE